jgi:hypothetical protein
MLNIIETISIVSIQKSYINYNNKVEKRKRLDKVLLKVEMEKEAKVIFKEDI